MLCKTKRIPHVFLLIFLFTTLSCSLFQNKEKLEKAKEIVELKKRNYAALQKSVRNNSLTKGTPPEAIRESFGEPDDIFYSGSSISSFQIWTYEKIMNNPRDISWDPIRLYFNNNQLESWKN